MNTNRILTSWLGRTARLLAACGLLMAPAPPGTLPRAGSGGTRRR